jgi:chromate transporter
MSEPPTAWRLARAFNQIALESFGGGLSAWSREVIVRERGWLSEEEYLSATAVCRILPGANQVNFAVFVGARLRGAPGAAAAMLGLLALPMLLVLLIGALYLRFRDLPVLHNFLAGMAAAAVGLTLATAWRQGRKVLVSPVPIGLFVLALGAGVLRTPLWLILVVLTPLGYAWAWRRSARA